jgi:hypothetical protein
LSEIIVIFGLGIQPIGLKFVVRGQPHVIGRGLRCGGQGLRLFLCQLVGSFHLWRHPEQKCKQRH